MYKTEGINPETKTLACQALNHKIITRLKAHPDQHKMKPTKTSPAIYSFRPRLVSWIGLEWNPLNTSYSEGRGE